MPTHQDITEAQLAAMLSRIPAFEHWRNQPLDDATMRWLREADHQQLMSLAVEALHRVMTPAAH